MKKLFLVLMLALFSLIPAAFAEEEEPQVYTSGEYQYILLPDGGAEIIQYTTNDAEIIRSTSDAVWL